MANTEEITATAAEEKAAEQFAEAKTEDRVEENTAISREEFDNLVSIVNGHTVYLDELNKIKEEYRELASWATMAGIKKKLDEGPLGPFDVVSVTKDGKPCKVPSSLFSSSPTRSCNQNKNECAPALGGGLEQTTQEIAPIVPYDQDPPQAYVDEVRNFFLKELDNPAFTACLNKLCDLFIADRQCDKELAKQLTSAMFRTKLIPHFAHKLQKFREQSESERIDWLRMVITHSVGERYRQETQKP